MKILVIGKTGQVGCRLGHLLPRSGETILAGRDTLDLTRPGSIRETIRAARPDVIVNAAGYTDVDRAESEKALAHAVNALAPGIMAEEAKRAGALLVHYSTAFVFDGRKAGAYTETDAPNPISEYGRSKLGGEEAVAAAGGAHLILRTNWVYDARGRNFLLTMLKLAETREALRVVDDQIGAPTWARSIAEATVAILRDLERAKSQTGVYNLTALGSVSRYEFTRRIMEMTRALRPGREAARLLPINTQDFPLPAARPLNSMLDNSRVMSTFGLPLTDWETQLRACVAELTPDAPAAP